jgi:hypothetical protein
VCQLVEEKAGIVTSPFSSEALGVRLCYDLPRCFELNYHLDRRKWRERERERKTERE